MMVKYVFALSFFTYSHSRRCRCSTLDRITTAKDAEEEGDEEDKKRMDQNEKVTSELTARAIIASCGRGQDGEP